MYNIGHTGPLNNIKNSWHGMLPSMQNEIFVNSGESRSSNDCYYRDWIWDEVNERRFQIEEGHPQEEITSLEDIQADSYCDRNECTLRESCAAYAELVGVEAPNQDDEVRRDPQGRVIPTEPFDPMAIALVENADDIEERFPETAEMIRDIHGGEIPENLTLEEQLVRQYQQAGVNIQHIIPREER